MKNMFIAFALVLISFAALAQSPVENGYDAGGNRKCDGQASFRIPNSRFDHLYVPGVL